MSTGQKQSPASTVPALLGCVGTAGSVLALLETSTSPAGSVLALCTLKWLCANCTTQSLPC